MVDLTRIGLVDVIVGAAVLISIVGALRQRRGLLGAAGAGVGSLLLAWLVVIAVAVWAPTPVATAARDSGFARTFPVPDRALQDLDRLGGPDVPAP